MRKIFFLALCLGSISYLSAQVKGVVIDSVSKSPVARVRVGMIIKSKITDTSYRITNEKGEFIFETIPSSNFSVVITNIGYTPVAIFIPLIAPQKIIDLGNITLTGMSKVLKEVVIEASPITIKEDTIEYRADAFKVKENAVVEDLLKKLPGVQVDKNGNINAQGKKVTKVKVNGKDFFGDDPKTATKELPANIVDKIQIIDDYGDQSTVSGIKDDDPQKVINIQFKKDKNTGFFGRLNIGMGNKNRYQTSFNGNYFNNSQQISIVSNSNNTNQSLFSVGGSGNRGMGNMINTGLRSVSDIGSGTLINTFSNGVPGSFQSGSGGSDGITNSNSVGMNYRDEWSKKISVYGSYSFSHHHTAGYSIISQQNLFQSETFINNQNNQFENKGDNHRFYFNLEYNIDSLNYFKISPNISYGSSSGISNTVFDYFKKSIGKISEGYHNNITILKNPNVSGNILYNHKFRKRGRNFSANLTSGTSNNESNQDFRNNTIQYVSPSSILYSFLYNKPNNTNYNYSVRFTYSEPLSKVTLLDLALSHNFSYTRNDKKTYNVNPSTGVKNYDSLLSNDYKNNYFNNRANISLRTTHKKYNYTLGISLQAVDLRGFSNTKDSAYWSIKRMNIFPVARFSYNFSKTKSLSFNYRGDAQQPSFSQLQDVLDISNPQYITRGNPHLIPSFNHNINLFYNDFNIVNSRVFFTSLSFNTIQNQIVNNINPFGVSGAQISIPENVNGYYNANGFYSYSKPYKNRRYIISLDGNLNYNHNINLIDNFKNIGNNLGISQGLNFEFNYKEWLEFAVGTNYNLNSVKYNNNSTNIKGFQNQQYSSWVISSNMNIDIPKNWVLKYDLDYTINNGLAGDIGKNLAIMNASLEKQLFKKKNGIIRFQGLDLLNQNFSINRTVAANSIIDTRSNRLNRYFMLSFTYRLQKFADKQLQLKNIDNIMPIRERISKKNRK